MNDLKYACRQVLKHPGFTAVAVLTLALGLGLNVSLFSIFSAATWHALPGVKAPKQVAYAAEPAQILRSQYEFYRDHNQSFSGLAASASGQFRLGTAEEPTGQAIGESIRMRVVAGDYFGVLGADPPVGRYFLPEECGERNGAAVIVISHRFWQQRFQGDPGVIGQTMLLENEAFTVVGIAPKSFRGLEPSRNFMEP